MEVYCASVGLVWAFWTGLDLMREDKNEKIAENEHINVRIFQRGIAEDS
jgi:hypothetical protein